MPDIHDMISLAEYAKTHDVDRTTVFRKVKAGRLPAIKVGSYWLISKDEPYIDHRIKDGTYVGDRAKRKARQTKTEDD